MMTRCSRRLRAAAIVAAVGLWAEAGFAQGPTTSPASHASIAARQASELELAELDKAASAALRAKDYANAIATAQRYFREGGSDTRLRVVLSDAYYANHDYPNAARELQLEVQAAERASRAPAEERLLLLQRCYQHLNDNNAYAWSLEKLVTYYPKKAYWADLLARTQRRPDFGARLGLDVDRLRLLTGVLATASDYLDMAERAQRAGLPAEARKTIELGFAKGVLGAGPDAARHRALRDDLARLAAEDERRIDRPETEAQAVAAKDGIVMHQLGLDHVMHGHYAKGIALMEAALRKGGLDNRPQDAKLRLGIAYLLAGDKAKAMDIFRTVGGMHGAADLGRLYGIYARNAAL